MTRKPEREIGPDESNAMVYAQGGDRVRNLVN